MPICLSLICRSWPFRLCGTSEPPKRSPLGDVRCLPGFEHGLDEDEGNHSYCQGRMDGADGFLVGEL